MESFLRTAKRFGRVLFSVLLAGVPAYFSKDPKYILLAPLINAVGKWLREKFGLNYVPF